MTKTAILQVADTGPLESLVIMLQSVDYECYLPSDSLKTALRLLKCDTVLDVDNLVRGMGYSKPFALPEASVSDMERCDIYVDIKAHRNGPKVWERWPNLKNKTLWYRINGGKPEHVIRRNDKGEVIEDCGDEANPCCPVLTPNQWYKECAYCEGKGWDTQNEDGSYRCGCDDPNCEANKCGFCNGTGDNPHAFTCYPPFYRFDEYLPVHGRGPEHIGEYQDPVCLIHSMGVGNGWGYHALLENMKAMGVKFYGDRAPDGLIQHRDIPALLSRTLAMVHLKSSDAPGYALLEAMAAACPIVCTRRLIWRCRMQELLIPGITCLVFDRETHEGLTPEDVESCTKEVAGHLKMLADPEQNRKLGEAGRSRLQQIMWSESKPEDVGSLRAFMERHFGQ